MCMLMYGTIHTNIHTQDLTVFINELYRNLRTLKGRNMVTERELGTVPDLSPKERAVPMAYHGSIHTIYFSVQVAFPERLLASFSC